MQTGLESRDRIDALTERYRLGEISETVYTASLKLLPPDEVRYLLFINQPTHRQSRSYKREFVK